MIAPLAHVKFAAAMAALVGSPVAKIALDSDKVPIGAVSISLGDVVGGVLLMLCAYLFRASIDHGKGIVKLEAKAEERRSADGRRLDDHEQALGVVEVRLSETRHVLRNEMTAHWAEVEDRLSKQIDELKTDIRAFIRKGT